MNIIPMNGIWPVDRRDLSQVMVLEYVSLFFNFTVKLRLHKNKYPDWKGREAFAHFLYRQVARRHTHLWNKIPS